MTIDWQSGGPSDAVRSEIDRWNRDRLITRLWDRDTTVWSDHDVPELANRLGWLTLDSTSRKLVATVDTLHAEAVANGITDIVLLGMGGSSLAPEVFASSLPRRPKDPVLTVLDSTHPDAVAAVDAATDPNHTWYVVASKSGTTLETMSFFHWFWARAASVLTSPGNHFIAITDPGTPLDSIASDRSFRASISADPTVGGRYSALTAFGLVPAGLAGADLDALLDAAGSAARQCGPDVDLSDNPAFVLGALMATDAAAGKDKAHFVAFPPIRALPIWAEQLIAESTGKDGKGIVPVDGGPFPSKATDGLVVALGQGHVPQADFTLTVSDANDIAGVMFILELATAIAGEMLSIHPFNQPDVELAKKLAASAMAGELGDSVLAPLSVTSPDLVASLQRFFAGSDVSYVSIHAYIEPTSSTEHTLESLRSLIDSELSVYTTSGYGPRFLHSTGQIHKGGPAGGRFLQIVDHPSAELAMPGSPFTFNELIAAQAAGDLAALTSNDRATVSVDIGDDPTVGLALLLEATRTALA